MTPRIESPQAEHRRLVVALREKRDALNWTQRDVADALDWSASKLIRIERGIVGISVTDLKALLQHYQVTETAEIDSLVAMARASKKATWWHEYRDVIPHEFYTFLGLEASAVRVKQFQGLVVPGLLQSRGYMEVLVDLGDKPSERARNGLAVRTKRQELFLGDGPEFSFVIDESVLYRQVGSMAVMREQLSKLTEMTGHSRVTIQILPYTAGIDVAMKGSFEILDFSEKPDDQALLLDLPHKDHLIQLTSEELKDYAAMFDTLMGLALSPAESKRVINRRLKEVEQDT